MSAKLIKKAKKKIRKMQGYEDHPEGFWGHINHPGGVPARDRFNNGMVEWVWSTGTSWCSINSAGNTYTLSTPDVYRETPELVPITTCDHIKKMLEIMETEEYKEHPEGFWGFCGTTTVSDLRETFNMGNVEWIWKEGSVFKYVRSHGIGSWSYPRAYKYPMDPTLQKKLDIMVTPEFKAHPDGSFGACGVNSPKHQEKCYSRGTIEWVWGEPGVWYGTASPDITEPYPNSYLDPQRELELELEVGPMINLDNISDEAMEVVRSYVQEPEPPTPTLETIWELWKKHPDTYGSILLCKDDETVGFCIRREWYGGLSLQEAYDLLSPKEKSPSELKAEELEATIKDAQRQLSELKETL